MREYELMYIVRPELEEEGIEAAANSVRSLVESQGGAVLETTMWGRRRLAYEVDRLREGHYVILRLSLDGGKVAQLERALRIHDQVFRHLLVVAEGTPPTPAEGALPGAARPEPGPAEEEPDDEVEDEGDAEVAPAALEESAV